MSRKDSLEELLVDLETFDLNLNTYYDELEPQGVYDSILSGKIGALMQFCRMLGWSNLATNLEDILPLSGSAPEAMEVLSRFVLPEIRHLMAVTDVDSVQGEHEWFWVLIHPRIRALSKPRFESGFLGDAVEASFKEVNDTVKRIYRDSQGNDIDGAGLMTTAFSLGNPIIRLSALETETDRAIQQGYMQIFAGSMTGIRNPKAHGNLNPDPNKALHLIALSSLLMHKIDERL